MKDYYCEGDSTGAYIISKDPSNMYIKVSLFASVNLKLSQVFLKNYRVREWLIVW